MRKLAIFVFVVWFIFMAFVGIKACDEVSAATGSKNYTIKDNDGHVKYRVHCEYGNCTAYDSRWNPQYKWDDPSDSTDGPQWIYDFNDNPSDNLDVDADE